MSSGALDWLMWMDPGTGDVAQLLQLARSLVESGNEALAATAYDRVFGLLPSDAALAAERRANLDKLAINLAGLQFRYVPAGTFLMGSEAGDQDERPVHNMAVDAFWMCETPISWAAYCSILNWEPPPNAHPRPDDELFEPIRKSFFYREENKIRLQYCEDGTTGATDWHAHAGMAEIFGTPSRDDPRRPVRYDRKPMVAVSWQEAEQLCARLSTPERICRLPTEAEWEKAARGGLIGQPYPWGDAKPSRENCDFDRFTEFAIAPFRRYPANGYGLYTMSGGVWEWTADLYDPAAYSHRASQADAPILSERVLRGGSWADSAEAVTTSFRMSRGSSSWESEGWGGHMTPNIGFRPCLARND